MTVTTLTSLTSTLDRTMSLLDWDADPDMSPWVPRLYGEIGYDIAEHFEPDFCARCNGLMLRAAEAIEEVYCAVFPSPEVLDRVLAGTTGKALLFVHHPLDMETSGRGFMPIPPPRLQTLVERGVSIYACHAPLDYHPRLGTGASMAQAFSLRQQVPFAGVEQGYAGRVGSISPVSVEALEDVGKRVFGVDRVERGGSDPGPVSRAAVVPGGGDDPMLLQEAEQLGAQAYISGEWYTRVRPPDEGSRRWAEENTAACRAYARKSQMALLAFSHAATEHLAMELQMAPYFREMGLRAFCVRPADWWR
jgi:putative NIF3 family GTP cyclohydrolase 1 type 2